MSVNKAILRLSMLFFIAILAACSPETEELLSQKWKTTSIDNSSLKKERAYYKLLMDTMTAKNEMIEFFGTVDSFKKVIIADLAEQDEIQKTSLENSFMDFNKNHIVYFTSVDGVDSSKWRLEENDIILEDEDFTGVPNLTRLSIVHITKDLLTVKMINQYDTSLISLKSIKK